MSDDPPPLAKWTDKVGPPYPGPQESVTIGGTTYKRFGDPEGPRSRVIPPLMPVEMPDLRTELISKWTSPTWKRAEMQQMKGDPRGSDASVRAHIQTLSLAELYWVGPEMCDLLYSTAPKVGNDVEPVHLPWPAREGLVVFAKSWNGLDANDADKNVLVDAIEWCRLPSTDLDGTVRDALNITFYRCVRWEEGLKGAELQLAVQMDLQSEARRGATMLQDGKLSVVLVGQSWMPIGRSTWPMDEALGRPRVVQTVVDADGMITLLNEITPADVTYAQSIMEDRSLISAFFALLDTHSLADVQETHPPRQVGRREMREGRKEPSKVRVVYLRRPASHGESTGTGESHYSHRWIVSAHPRNQPYGPGNSKRKLIIVPAHVKGPEDKELVVKEKVNAWVR